MIKTEIGKVINHRIVIDPSANMGFNVKVGCAELVFENQKTLVQALHEYLDDPEKYEREYGKLSGPTAEEVVEETAPPNRGAIGGATQRR